MIRRQIFTRPFNLNSASCAVALAIAMIMLMAAVSAPLQSFAAQSNPSIENLTNSVIGLTGQHGKAADNLKPALLARLQTLAAQRHQQLAALIESDPGAVLNVALPAIFRQTAPVSVRNYLEEQVDLDGELTVLHEDRTQGSRFVYTLKAFGLDYSLNFRKDPPTHLSSGARVRVRGVRVNTALALDSAASVQALAAIAPNTFGEQRTLVMLVNFRNNTAQPYDVTAATNVFTTTSNFFLENSYQIGRAHV